MTAANARLNGGAGAANISLTDCMYPGLKNFTNTCYMNSLVQCLAYNPFFTKVILSNAFVSNDSTFLSKLKPFMECLNRLQNTNGNTDQSVKRNSLNELQRHMKVCVEHAWTNFETILPHRQDDPVELFRYITNEYLDTTLNESGTDTPLLSSDCVSCERRHPPTLDAHMHRFRNVFGYMYKKDTTCVFGEDSDTATHSSPPNCSNVLELAVQKRDQSYLSTVQEAIDYLAEEESIEKENFWRCSCVTSGKKLVGQTIKDSISNSSDVLIVQRKIFHGITSQKITPQSAGKQDGFTFKNNKILKVGDVNYELQAVIVHVSYGPTLSLNSGHFIAYVKTDVVSDSWKKFSDRDVVVAVDFETTVQTANGYMLFYNRQTTGKYLWLFFFCLRDGMFNAKREHFIECVYAITCLQT